MVPVGSFGLLLPRSFSAIEGQDEGE